MAPNDHTPAALSILYVEDDPDARRIASLLVSRKFPDFAILKAENGQVGLELFREHRPEIVITDINMPVMDGIRMAKEIRAIDPNARIIAVTAHSDQSYLRDAESAGITHYLLKPMDRKKLYEVIEACIADIAAQRQKP